MISHPHRYIFPAINKTATTSIMRQLKKHTRVLMPKHEMMVEVKKRITPEQFQSYFKFAIVRNPWDRILSLYCYRYKWNYSKLKRDRIPFRQWIHLTFEKKMPKYRQAGHIRFILPQWRWLVDTDGRMIMDYIGSFEDIEKSWREICSRINIPYAPLGTAKKTKHSHYQDVYDKHSRKIIAREFKSDIKNFGYTFEGGRQCK